MGVTLDTGALIAAERRPSLLRSSLWSAVRTSAAMTVPTVVIAQSWRNGSRQAKLARLLADCDIEPLDESLARRAGELMARTGTADAVDAIVALSAAMRRDIVLTSDPIDFARLAEALNGRITVIAV